MTRHYGPGATYKTADGTLHSAVRITSVNLDPDHPSVSFEDGEGAVEYPVPADLIRRRAPAGGDYLVLSPNLQVLSAAEFQSAFMVVPTGFAGSEEDVE
jgi:hypothetical protein